MIVLSFIPPPQGFELGFWSRPEILRSVGLVLGVLCGVLRNGRKTAPGNHDWPTSSEVVLLVLVAIAVTVVEIHFSQRIGLLTKPPEYDGAGYLADAKHTLVQLRLLTHRPIRFANVLMANRYPVWQSLLLLNYELLGLGEWQSYVVRFWPTLVILGTTFWVVRRRSNQVMGWAAVLVTALLPTLSMDLRSAAAGHHLFPSGYLMDLRPDIFFAALVMAAVAIMVENADTFDERTGVVVGIVAALAALTKTSAIAAILLSCGVAGAYVLLVNRNDLRSKSQAVLWAMLAFAMVLTPWMLAGGVALISTYLREVLTVHLPLYSNPNPTILGEALYYMPLLVDHMGWETVVMVAASMILMVFDAIPKRRTKLGIREPVVYLSIAGALYVLVSLSPAKNYFLGLPSYWVLWVACWVAITGFVTSRRAWAGKIEAGFFGVAIASVALVIALGARGLGSWQGHELAEGQQDRQVMRQIATDLRELLSNEESFFPMVAYGAPATLLFYMPDRDGEFPKAVIIDGLKSPPVDQFVREEIESTKAVLVYEGGNKESSFKGFMPAMTLPYYRAIAEWVHRPGSPYHLRKTYRFYRAPGADQAAVELYVRDDLR